MANTTKPEKAKITIEIPGQDTIVLDKVDDFMVFHGSGKHLASVGIATTPFLIRIFKVIKEHIDKALCNNLAEFLGR